MSRATELFDDRSGVSPVIGVILIVAVTVIIAAVIGSSVLGLSNSVSETPPQAQLSPEQVDGVTIHPNGGRVGEYSVVEFELTGGDNIDLSNVGLQVNGKNAYDLFKTDSTPSGSPDNCGGECHYTTTPDKTIQAGDTVTVAVKQSEAGESIGDDPRSFSVADNGFLHINGDDQEDSTAVHLEDGDDVALVWESGDKSQILAEYEVEDPVVERTA